MGNDICILLTLVYSDGFLSGDVLKVAIKLKEGALTEDEIKYYREPENTAKIKSLLPLHCRDFKFIAEVEGIFEIIERI